MWATLRQLDAAAKVTPTRNKGGRPTKASKGLNPDDRPAWMAYRDCVVLATVERARAQGKTRGEAALAAIAEWKRRQPLGKLSSTEVDAILSRAQPENLPDDSWRADVQVEPWPETEIIDGKMKLTGRMIDTTGLSFRPAERPNYPKRGSGKRKKFQFSKRMK
jgi:hypothetical protein